MIGTTLKLYSISWTPNGNMDLIFSLKYCSLGFRKKDKKNVWIKEIIEWNSIAGYCLGKLLKKNKLAIIFDRAIKVPKIKDKISLKIILKLFIKWQNNNKTDRILVNIIKIIGPDPEWKKFAKIIADKIK